MEKPLVNFKQERDFGDIFNGAFIFIGQEFKRLATVFLYYVVPMLILTAITSTIYSLKAQEFMQNITSVTSNSNDPMAVFSQMGPFYGNMLIYILFWLLAQTMMVTILYSYIKLYVQSGPDGFSVNDVWSLGRKNFLKLFFASIIIGILIMFGMIFCFIPGIYLAIALSMMIPVIVFEEEGLSNGFSRAFKLIKSKWWFTLGVLIVAVIIVYILSILLSVPAMVMGFKSMLFKLKQTEEAGLNFSVGFYVFNSITNLLTQIIQVIPIVVTAFLYYSFVEEKEKVSLLEKIDEINEDA